MQTMLFKSSLRYLLKHPWQIGLAILGIALGVAMVVSIDLANLSAQRAFELSAETVTGRATHQIVGAPSGIDEEVYRRLRTELGFRESAPLVSGYVNSLDYPGLALQVLGVDPLAEAPFRPYLAPSSTNDMGNMLVFLTTPNAALLPSTTAKAYGIEAGDTLQLEVGTRTVSATVVGLLEGTDESSQNALDGLIVVDVATAQVWFDMIGKLTSIDLIVPEGAAGEQSLEAIRAILPADTLLENPTQRTQSIKQMTDAFELNLSALSLLALIVGMFLIYNTVTFSVVQRRGLFGTLRCLGVTRTQVFVLTLAESIVVGLIGAVLGLGLGIVLGRGLVGLVTRTINDLYFSVSVRDVVITQGPLLKGFLLGMIATIVAAAVPAFEATFTPPRSVLRRSSFEERVRALIPWIALAGAVLLALGIGMLWLPSDDLILSFSALFLITVGAAAVTPLITLLFMQALRPMLGKLFGLLGRMATRDVIASLSRTSIAIAALMIAIAVMSGIGLMVGSFRTTVVNWLDSSLRSNIYIAAPSLALNRDSAALPQEIIDRIEQTEGVTRVLQHFSTRVPSPEGTTVIMADQFDQRAREVLQMLPNSPDFETIWREFDQGSVLISEPLSFRRGLGVGDKIRLLTAQGEHDFPIAGVYYDYGSDQGVVLMDLSLYRQYWQDLSVSSVGIDAAPGYDIDELVLRLRNEIGAINTSIDDRPREVIEVRSNQALRETTLEVFDRTFAITRVLQLLATIVAFVGILAALMALQLERTRELGMLRANGLTPGQLWGVVMSQTGLMGLTAGLLSIPMGIGLAQVLVYVINKRSFGWTLVFHTDVNLFIQSMLVAIVAALLAGLYPAWRMSHTSPAMALREE
jgi:putative ABC transport system permease protein